ncbi:MAG: endonuclease/exonuclease/phosphatase family protein [Oscillospiraceae bacterium]|nr:endonuclease/exonuclease/phosphatase family protein [Oscillospiraceae bacterium]
MARPLRIATFNIAHGTDGAKNETLEKQIKLLQLMALDLSPDVVFLQELDKNALRSGGIDQLDKIAGELGYYNRFMSENLSFDTGGSYGVGIMTNLPRLKVRKIPLVVGEGREPRGIANMIVEHGGQLIHLYCCHYPTTEEERVDASYVLAEDIAKVKQVNSSGVIVVGGDFNWGKQKLGGDHNYDRKVSETYPEVEPLKRVRINNAGQYRRYVAIKRAFRMYRYFFLLRYS